MVRARVSVWLLITIILMVGAVNLFLLGTIAWWLVS